MVVEMDRMCVFNSMFSIKSNFCKWLGQLDFRKAEGSIEKVDILLVSDKLLMVIDGIGIWFAQIVRLDCSILYVTVIWSVRSAYFPLYIEIRNENNQKVYTLNYTLLHYEVEKNYYN